MPSQSPSPIVAAAAAAAAMVTMAGTIWLMSDTKYEEDSSSEELDIYCKRQPKSSLLKGTKYSTKYSRRRRRKKQRRVRWSDQNDYVWPIATSPKSPPSLSDAAAASSSSNLQAPPLTAQDSSYTSTSAPKSPSSQLTSSSTLSEKQSDLPANDEGNSKSQNKSSTSSPLSSISSWSKSSPLVRISILQESAANVIYNSANSLERKQETKMNQNQIMAAPAKPTSNHANTNGSSNAASSDAQLTNGHYYHSRSDQHTTKPYTRFIEYLKPLRQDAWAEPDTESFMVRGPNYINDSKKVNSARAVFSLLTVDLIEHIGEGPYCHPICGHPRERVQQAIKREEEFGSAVKELPPFVFAVNLCLPSGSVSITSKNGTTSYTNQYYHQVSYFGIESMDEIENETTPFGKLMKKFIFGDDDSFRDKAFKLIPKIVKGNILVRRVVGSKPAIVGKKVKQHYFRGDRYFEILVDLGSDGIADRIVKLALGYAKSLVTEICFVLEGTDSETLPERIFGGVTLKYIDFKSQDGDRRMLPLDYSL